MICQNRFNISTLVNDGIITILSSTQSYFSGDMLEMDGISSVSGMTVSKSLSPIHKDTRIESKDTDKGSHFNLSVGGGKRLRALYDMTPFFEKKYCEASSQKGTSRPTDTLCAYEIGLMSKSKSI